MPLMLYVPAALVTIVTIVHRQTHIAKRSILIYSTVPLTGIRVVHNQNQSRNMPLTDKNAVKGADNI